MRWDEYDGLIRAALSEDRAAEDVTSLLLVPEGALASARVAVRAAGVVCGLPLAGRVLDCFGQGGRLEPLVSDGDRVARGAEVARLEGPARALLAVERTMLNFLQQLSGVATLTARYVEAVAATGARIYDTRKTIPGWRALQKYAVRCGGGLNHRPDLAGALLIKDNHLALVGPGGARRAVESSRAARPGLTVEVEVDTLEQLAEVLPAGPHIVLLDNMTPDQVRQAAHMVHAAAGRGAVPQLEASGGITLDNVREYALAGADRIAVGALTHSAPALDISVEFDG